MLYYIVHYIHVLIAVTSLGIALVFPIMLRSVKATNEAKQMIELFQKLKYVPYLGIGVLMITSVVMLTLEPEILTELWFALSFIAYVLIQCYTALILPRRLQQQSAILEAYTDEDIPAEYRLVLRKKLPIEVLSQLLVLALIFLLVFKPL